MAKLELLGSPNSPFVHKVLIAAHELGIRDQIDTSFHVVAPVSLPNEQVGAANPLAKIPVLLVPNSSPIYDSSVIVQYLDSLAPADRKVIPPPSDPKRYEALTIESLGDGILDAAILVRYETVLREKEQVNAAFLQGQQGKMQRGLAKLLNTLVPPADSAAPLPIDALAVANVLWYMGRRFPDLAWWEWQGGAAMKEWYDKVKDRKGWAMDDHPIS